MSEYSALTQFIDLAAQQKLIRPQLDLAISRVLDHGQYIMGPEVKEFESQLREFTGARHALTCANGTDALTLVLMAWGLGTGDAVFVPSFTYVATAEAPAQLGATPFFVDVCEDTFNIDPQSFKQAIIDSRKLGLKPAAVILVDLFGQPADVDAITEVAHAESIKVLVDGAQSFGATSKERRVGSMGDATTTSFFPAKPLGCYGDGGAVFTSSDEDAEIINSIRLHGKGSQKYDNVRIGMNSRLDTIQAAILIEKLKLFPEEVRLRSLVAENYSKLLLEVCKVPVLLPENTSSWAQYTLTLDHRDNLQNKLKDSGVPSVVYYPIPLSKQLGYRQYPSVSNGVVRSEKLSEKVLSLPMHPYLSEASQMFVSEKIKCHINNLD
ncbi:DegT/DnrJ/EryC1/StrS family aminotransferase [Pseudomonadales bacterium]|nr:DegT/DnrJ/EryC1/StrS family aminotransferase [Pseudomonadales bacterium]MDA7771925.1 DegT/DnrJ/EryC1/StrS family aminotransferase [Pseudomonadales bacterium]